MGALLIRYCCTWSVAQEKGLTFDILGWFLPCTLPVVFIYTDNYQHCLGHLGNINTPLDKELI